MDELNPKNRKELLKHMILQLHEGEAPKEVRGRLVELLKTIPYNEVVTVEQELINEGLPEEEVLKFCDIHHEAKISPIFTNPSNFLINILSLFDIEYATVDILTKQSSTDFTHKFFSIIFKQPYKIFNCRNRT